MLDHIHHLAQKCLSSILNDLDGVALERSDINVSDILSKRCTLPEGTSSYILDSVAVLQSFLENVSTLPESSAQYLSLKASLIGKKSDFAQLAQHLRHAEPAQKPIIGKCISALKSSITEGLDLIADQVEQAERKRHYDASKFDITFPPDQLAPLGTLHPISIAKMDILSIFNSMGFKSVDGPEMETEHYNFDALNFPHKHPARAMHDTFYLDNHTLLRTHTSAVQIREGEASTGPLRLVSSGRVYRKDYDATHTPMFHQVEGLFLTNEMVVSVAHLKGVIGLFLSKFFGQEVNYKLRASFFPFTEPSFEVDIACIFCKKNASCSVCSDTGWLEVMGAGLVHPNVVSNMGRDPKHDSGFAFGMGIDRLCMLKYGIPDLRELFANDSRFLDHHRSLV